MDISKIELHAGLFFTDASGDFYIYANKKLKSLKNKRETIKTTKSDLFKRFNISPIQKGDKFIRKYERMTKDGIKEIRTCYVVRTITYNIATGHFEAKCENWEDYTRRAKSEYKYFGIRQLLYNEIIEMYAEN